MPEQDSVLPDISQRVMAALSADGECPDQPGCLPLQDGETPILTVPPHLRRLNLLLCLLNEEVNAAMLRAMLKFDELRAVGNLYHESIRVHIPGFEKEWGGMVPVLREGWQVVLVDPNAPLCRPEAQDESSYAIFAVPKFDENLFERPF